MVNVMSVNQHSFQKEVMESDRKVLVDFWAPWCGPCRMVAPVLEQIAQERPDVKVVKVNVDEEFDLASQYRVMSIPTLMVMDKGQIVNKAAGVRPKGQILAML